MNEKELMYNKFLRGEIDARTYVLYSLCTNHTEKMAGMVSISTACSLCERCRNRHEGASLTLKQAKKSTDKMPVCWFCYAFSNCKMHPALDRKLISNYYFYNNYNLKDSDVPVLNYSYFRFEAFGDLNSAQQFKNYCTIAKNNKNCTFTIFSKNCDIIKNAINLYGVKIPANLIIIYSNILINDTADLEKIKEKYPFVNKVFNVYTEPAAEQAHVCYNCKGESCINCLRCYKKSKSDKNNNLFEGLK